MKVIAWNMAHKVGNWTELHGSEELVGTDVALLSEAESPPDGVNAVGRWSTSGLDAALPPDKPMKRDWSTGIMSPHKIDEIHDARVDRNYGEHLPFGPSREGSWIAATVTIDGTPITAVSLYGLLDEKSDASVHRSLSEMAPLFDHETYAERLILGGDLNILAGRPVGEQLDRHQVVLARIKAYGLIDCLERKREPGALAGCPCELGEGCTHTWTKYDARNPGVAYQDDYLFASRRLADQLRECRAVPVGPHLPSDHAPIVARFGA
jgi:hypothetical protein